MSEPISLLIRADASTAIGAGHVMRCLALAQACRDHGGTVTFLSAENIPSLEERIRQEGCLQQRISVRPGSSDDADAMLDAARTLGMRRVVVDGYAFDAAYYERLATQGLQLLVIDDDVHAERYSGDILLNQGFLASEDMYSQRDPRMHLLLGPCFALLRREFLHAQDVERTIPDVAQHLLITLGGTDPQGATLHVLRALRHLPENIKVTVVVGKDNPHCEDIRSLAQTFMTPVHVVIQARDMSDYLRVADIVVSAGGTSCFEAAAFGVPALLLVLAANQRHVAAGAVKEGMALHLGVYGEVSEEHISARVRELIANKPLRARMSENGRKLVDGFGALRVHRALAGRSLWLRGALQRDVTLLFSWANDPLVRSSSLSPQMISWEEHRAWFLRKLRDTRSAMFVGFSADDLPVGQIRFDVRDDGEVDIDLHTAPMERGKGYGTAFITQGVQLMVALRNVHVFHAFVRSENAASSSSFNKAGFTMSGTTTIKGVETLHFLQQVP